MLLNQASTMQTQTGELVGKHVRCVCVCATYIYIYIHAHITSRYCAYVYVQACELYMYMYTCMHVYMCIHADACVYIYISATPLPEDLHCVIIRYVLGCLVFLLILSPVVALHQECILGACAWTHPAHICSCSIAL